jgi:hypothetical protein
MMQLLEIAKQLGEGGLAAINSSGFLTRAGANLGLDITGIIKSEKQMAQEAQQAKQDQMAQALAPQMAQGMIEQQGQVEG